MRALRQIRPPSTPISPSWTNCDNVCHAYLAKLCSLTMRTNYKLTGGIAETPQAILRDRLRSPDCTAACSGLPFVLVRDRVRLRYGLARVEHLLDGTEVPLQFRGRLVGI